MEQVIIKYCAKISENNIFQGDQNWKDDKQSKFGGTSMGYFTRAKYKQLIDLVKKYTKLDTSTSKKYVMNFGSMFEELVKRVAEHDTKSTTHGENIYVMYNDFIAYSPDGIAYLDTSLFDGPNEGMQICLQEFKCPFSRYPNGTIPEEYVAQQQLGMAVIPICKYSLYLEAVFRRCTLKQLGPNAQYDHDLNIFNENKPQVVMTNMPLAWGFIGFSADISTTHELFDKLKTNIDIGSLSTNDMKVFIEIYGDNIVTPHYYDLLWYNDDYWKEKLKKQLDKFRLSIVSQRRLIGILPYKLFRRDYHWVKPIEGFLDKYIDEMEATMDLIKRINAEPDISSKYKLLDRFFDPFDCF